MTSPAADLINAVVNNNQLIAAGGEVTTEMWRDLGQDPLEPSTDPPMSTTCRSGERATRVR